MYPFTECTGKKVDSVQAAQDLRGCTRIIGALEIRINKGSKLTNTTIHVKEKLIRVRH